MNADAFSQLLDPILLVPALLYLIGLLAWRKLKAHRARRGEAEPSVEEGETPRAVDGAADGEEAEARPRKKTRRGNYTESFSEESCDEADTEVQEAIRAAAEVRQEQAGDLSSRLSKTRSGFLQRVRELFGGKPRLDDDMLDELESILVASDLGVVTAEKLLDGVEDELDAGQVLDERNLIKVLKKKILAILTRGERGGAGGLEPQRHEDGPHIIMLVGVNGAGKTTTAAKLASLFKDSGLNVVLTAADTFRAAAVEQLNAWGERIGVPVISGLPNAKPATVVFDAMVESKKHGADVVVIDTAGRLHTKSNLMEELEGVLNTIKRHQPGAPHETLLVVDGTTGQNALSQAREFNQSVPLTGVVVTKLDGTPKGGIVVAIKDELNIPIKFIGVGESDRDLRPFSPEEFVNAIFDSGAPGGSSSHGEARRRRREDGEG